MVSCTESIEHTAEAVNSQDSLPFMHSVGISTLISDSGVIRYHLVAEEWDIYTPQGEQATWKFSKGLLMTRLDNKFHVDLHIQADTAYLYQQRLWELRGRVKVRNIEGTVFHTEHLWWDLSQHEMWNHTHMTIISPERTLNGTEFRSNEQMTRYSVSNTIADFPISDTENEDTVPQLTITTADTPQPTSGNTKNIATGTSKTKILEPAPDKRQYTNKR